VVKVLSRRLVGCYATLNTPLMAYLLALLQLLLVDLLLLVLQDLCRILILLLLLPITLLLLSKVPSRRLLAVGRHHYYD